MSYFLKRFSRFNFWVKVIFFFCLFGVLVNTYLLCKDIRTDGVLFRLHAGFWVLYLSQAVFILLQERYVAVLAVVQGLLALFTNADFTFVPLLQVLSRFYFAVHPTPSLEAIAVYKYVFISLAFTLQMLGAYTLFSLIPKYLPKKTEPSVTDLPKQS